MHYRIVEDTRNGLWRWTDGEVEPVPMPQIGR